MKITQQAQIEKLKNTLKLLIEAIECHELHSKRTEYAGGDIYLDQAIQTAKENLK